MSQWRNVWRLIPLFVVLASVLAGCGGDPYLTALDPKGPVAAEQLSLIKLSLGIMIGVFVVVMAIFTYVLIKFRKRPGQNGIPKQVEGNHLLEVIWTVIPLILLFILAVPTVKTTFSLAEKYSAEDGAIKVKVIAHQFWWEYQYPDLKIQAAQDLYIPTGTRIQFDVQTADVNHSFWVPTLGGKIDTNPGQWNHMWLQADQPGVYKGKCAELCGASHALMDFKVVAVEPKEFDEWVNKMKQPVAKPATATAQQGQEVFKQNCMTCHAVGDQGGKLGPNLTNFGDREKVAGIMDYNKKNIAEWIKHPEQYKPGNKMPGFSTLNDQQVNNLVEYLDGLKVVK